MGHIMKWTDFDGPARQAQGIAARLPAGSARRQAAPEAGQPRAAASPARPLVSVVIPTFNRPDRLLEAVASVRAQTYPNVEIVVVNDGGVEVGDRLAALGDRRLRYVRHKENSGLAAARNTGIRATTGKYLAYLDDDDLFYPDHLETLVGALESGSHRVAYTDAHRAHQVLENGSYVTTLRVVPYSLDFDADRMLDANFVPVLCFLHDRSCLDAVGAFDESLKRLEDWDLWIRMSRKFPFLHIRKITCEFSWRGDGTSMTSLEDDSFAIARRRIRKAYGNVPGLKEQLAEAERRRHAEEERVAVLRRAPSEAIARLVKCAELSRRHPQTLLWGAGEGGRRARRVLEGLGIAVSGFLDSNAAKAGSIVDGLPVVAPDSLDAAEAGGCRPLVAIASVAHEAIGRELQRRGWCEGVDYLVLPVADMPGFE
jgi:glycosyltransferase involved in cell wall biosynthesis